MDKLRLLKRVFGEDAKEEALKLYLSNIDEALKTLTEREQFVLTQRFSGMTQKATGLALASIGNSVTRGRVRQIEIKALRKLRHARRLDILLGNSDASDFLTNKFSIELLASADKGKSCLIEKMGLSTRTANCMKNAKIDTIGQLISKTKKDLMNTKKFGRKCLNEIVKTLDDMGLSLRS